MNAISELPRKNMDVMIPAVQLKPWLNSTNFSKSTEKVINSIGNNVNWIANLDVEYASSKKSQESDRPSAVKFRELKDPSNGYENWVNFITENPKCIPTLLLFNEDNIQEQAKKLDSLGRGLVVHLYEPNQTVTEIITNSVKGSILFILDFGEIGKKSPREIAREVAVWTKFIRSALDSKQSIKIAISSSSFPGNFEGLTHARIMERELFNTVVASLEQKYRQNFIYSDRGGARIKPLGGGGNIPRPRIDYPTPDDWFFFRSAKINISVLERDSEYSKMARKAIQSEHWKEDLNIWATDMIKKTAAGETKYGINTPVKSTAVRLNLHMHNQAFYGDSISLLNTEDDWVD